MATVEVVGTPNQILRGTTVTLSAQFYADGVAADPGTTTVGIVNVVGDEVVASGTATSGTTTGPRTYSLSATDDLDILTVTWTTTNFGTLTTTHEIVGAFLFSLVEARAYDGGAMTTAKVSTSTLEAARARLTDQFEAICGVSFIPRYRRDVVSGTGLVRLRLPRLFVTSIRSAEYRTSGAAAWTAFDADDVTDLYVEDAVYLLREARGIWTIGNRNLRIGYEHGFETPPPDITRAALMAARYELIPSNINDRAISITTDQGTEQLWTPGLSGRGTAIHPLPEVDRILKLFDFGIPVVA